MYHILSPVAFIPGIKIPKTLYLQKFNPEDFVSIPRFSKIPISEDKNLQIFENPVSLRIKILKFQKISNHHDKNFKNLELLG